MEKRIRITLTEKQYIKICNAVAFSMDDPELENTLENTKEVIDI